MTSRGLTISSCVSGTHPTLNAIDGATAPVAVNRAGGESDLDFELAIPIIYPQTTTLYQTDDALYSSGNISTGGIFNTFLDALDGSYCTYSAYGETGDDPELDPTYPDPNPGGYKGQLQCGVYKPTNVRKSSNRTSGLDDTIANASTCRSSVSPMASRSRTCQLIISSDSATNCMSLSPLFRHVYVANLDPASN